MEYHKTFVISYPTYEAEILFPFEIPNWLQDVKGNDFVISTISHYM